MDVVSKLAGSTVWVYIPLEDIFTSADKTKKPEKFIERFSVENSKGEFSDNTLKLDYLIKTTPEQEKSQPVSLNKDFFLKNQYVFQVMFRMLFSVKPQKSGGLQFFSVVFADTKKGFIIRNVYYHLDIKKMAYGLLSQTEFQHRTVQDIEVAPEVIGDKEGKAINYNDITMKQFIVWQILNRIRLKFQKPEVERTADIDKEIEKIVANTIKIYDFRDFDDAQLNNLLANKRLLLNRAAILSKPIE